MAMGPLTPTAVLPDIVLTHFLDYTTRTFESRRGREPMRRRPRSAIQLFGYLLVMRIGWISRGWSKQIRARLAG